MHAFSLHRKPPENLSDLAKLHLFECWSVGHSCSKMLLGV